MHPRSIAASAIFGSNVRNLGITDKITYGIQNAICARSIVVKPVLILREENSNINPIAVTISGFNIGRLFTCVTISFTIFLDFDKPIAVIVPTNVDTIVAMTAISTVYQIASIIERLLNIASYHFVEKPVNLVKDFERLNEKNTT